MNVEVKEVEEVPESKRYSVVRELSQESKEILELIDKHSGGGKIFEISIPDKSDKQIGSFANTIRNHIKKGNCKSAVLYVRSGKIYVVA